MAYRSGEIKDIAAHAVYEKDEFEYELGLDPKLRHVPALKNRGQVILYYAVFHTKNGGSGFEVMSVDDIQQYAARYSKNSGSSYSPWKTNFDAMAKKTLIKQVLKYAPIKTEFVREVTADETIKTNISEHMLDMADETTIDAETTEAAKEEAPADTDKVDKETGEILKPEDEKK